MDEDGYDSKGSNCQQQKGDECKQECVMFVAESGDEASSDDKSRKNSTDSIVGLIIGAIEPGVQNDDVDNFDNLGGKLYTCMYVLKVMDWLTTLSRESSPQKR